MTCSADHEPPEPRELLDRLPFGVLLFDRSSRACTYRNAHAARWGPTDPAAAPDSLPWDPGHLDNVAAKLEHGPFTEPLPRDTTHDTPPAEVHWRAMGDALLATVRDLSDREEQRMVLDDLDFESLLEGGLTRRRTALEPLCWEVAEALAGDRRPLGVEVLAGDTAVFGDPELLRAAIVQVTERATGAEGELTPVTLRLSDRDGSVAIEVEEAASGTEAVDEASRALGLARRLVTVHGGYLRVHTTGSVRRTELVLPRA